MPASGDGNSFARIDLSSGKIDSLDLGPDAMRRWVGGKPLAARLLKEVLPPGADPLGEDNVLVLLAGPLTGTGFPAASRACLATRSPLTGTFSDSYCGGKVGPYLRRAGWDAVLIRGRAGSPVYLLIEPGRITLQPAGHMRGMTTRETARQVRSEWPDRRRLTVATIGPAGENLVSMANVINGGRAFGRGGIGAVFGAKNLKAVAVVDGERIEPKQKDRFEAVVKDLRRRLREHPSTRPGGDWNRYGTRMTLALTRITGTLPTLNWQENGLEASAAMEAEGFEPLILRSRACLGCPIACSRVSRAEVGGRRFETEGPEYETIYAFGPNLGIDQPEVVVAADHLCSDYGLDTISTGVTIGMAMECRQRGLLPESGIEGVDLTFGDGAATLEAIERIAYRRGLGDLLARGAQRAAEEIPGAAGLAMTVKGLELPGYDPRGMKGQSLTYALADRGGCHLRSSTLGPELMGHPPGHDRKGYEGKAELIDSLQLDKIVFNTLPVCLFAGVVIRAEDGAEAASALTGHKITVEGLRSLARTTRDLIRRINGREGFGRENDTLPARLFEEGSTRGASRDEVVDHGRFLSMLEAYYRRVGWSEETGNPP